MAYQPFGYQPNMQMQQQIPMNFYPQSMQQMQQPMQMQQVQQNQSSGKIVDSIDMVKFTDVPMDGNPYYFPKADGTEIYSKRWLANGTTEINTFVKVDVNNPEEEKQQFDFNLMENNIMEKLNSLDERMAKLEKGFSKPVTSKKEV